MYTDLLVSFDEIMKEFDELMNRDFSAFNFTSSAVELSPPIDLCISKDMVYLSIALPGFTKEEISVKYFHSVSSSVNVKDNTLVVEANVKGGSSGHNSRIIRKKSQIVRGNVKLEWKVDPAVHDLDAMDVSLSLGILYINIPFRKVEQSKSFDRTFEIK